MPTSRFQPSFAAGVLGPGLHGRIDIAKYDVGLKVGTNVFIHEFGGCSNRAGLEFVGEVMDHTKFHRLVPFERDDEERYVMVMGDQEMKIVFDAAFVQDGGSDYNPVTPFAESDLELLDFVQSIDVMYFASQQHFPQKMSRTSAVSWTFADLPIDPAFVAPTNIQVTSANAGTVTYTYVVAPVVDGVIGFPSASGSSSVLENLDNAGAINTVTWDAAPVADEYNIYRERNGVFGYVGFSESLSFEDANVAPDLTVTPVEASGIFGGAGEYPGSVTMIQQRLCFGGSATQPETAWLSRTGDFENFTRSRITQATDRIEEDLTGPNINTIRNLLPLRELLCFTENGIFAISGLNGNITATSPTQTQYGYSGASKVKPLPISDTILFVESTNQDVRDLRYAFEQDGYDGNDLTVLAKHFFEGKAVRGWCYSKKPFSIIWAYLDDGTLLSLTYKREHQIWAWTEHDVGGAVESAVAIREGTQDSVYMIVRRTINGNTRRYIERMHERDFVDAEDAFFVDSGLTYEGAATTTISGLDHLEGEDVVALADGDVVENLTVSGGSVTLAVAASKVHVGLPFTAEIENLPPAVDLDEVGSGRGRPMKASGVYIQLERTRGLQVGSASRDKFNEVIQTAVDLALDIPLFTGMVDVSMHPEWNRDGTVVLRQPYPLPMTVLGISPKLNVGRSG